jgi:hypothetical protein
MSHLSKNGLCGMVFEHLWNYFYPKNFMSGFPQLFQLCFHITQGHISYQIIHVFGATHLLTMTKFSSGICRVTMGEMLN